MFQGRTVFVVGAGASKEVGLPTGEELLRIIGPMLDFRFRDPYGDGGKGSFDPDLAECIRVQSNSQDERDRYFAAGRKIKHAIDLSSVNSIDEYLDTHNDDKYINFCGKIAIAKAILSHEKSSALGIRRTNDPFNDLPKIGLSWLSAFFRLLQPGASKKDMRDVFHNISFVVFNYDRCIEQYLLSALRAVYDIDLKTAVEILRTLKVFRPFGSLGPLPWQSSDGRGVEFGGHTSQHNFNRIASSIRTFTEQTKDGDELAEIHDTISRADRLVFLGFAYRKSTLDLIAPPNNNTRRKIFGTAFEIPEPNLNVISINLWQRFVRARDYDNYDTSYIKLASATCAQLFRDYRLSLAIE